jgi:putative copper export protein
MYRLALLLHLIGAAIWTGGHLLLATRVVPRALREQNPEHITAFETTYEPVGIPALIVQVVTGLWMAFGHYKISLFEPGSAAHQGVVEKLILLTVIAGLAVHARFFIIPELNGSNLKKMAWHVWLVTALSVLMILAGVLHFRF